MGFIHYIIVVPIILLIVCFQIKVYCQALRKIGGFKDIFPSNRLAYSVKQANIQIEENGENDLASDHDDSEEIWREDSSEVANHTAREVEVSQISVNSTNPTIEAITDALNMYLQKNKGAASDFSLMKDVVERYCGAEEDEISVMQPIPLYMGLMGTMIGIIAGISVIAFNGGVDQLSNVSSMMTCVSIAMFASLIGILFTTLISWKSKNAKSQVESRKNVFYSWLQTELLPVLSGNSLTALSLLQTNLMTFNQTFQANIKEFDFALSSVRQVSASQAEALGAISRIDIARVAQANISVLRELQQCMGELGKFNQYLNSVNGYLNAVNELNANLNSHLDRTAAIEKMGAFFESEITQVQSREKYIEDVVASVDRSLMQSFGQMQSSMSDYMTALKTRTEQEMETMKESYLKQNQEVVERIKSQQESLFQKTDELSKVVDELKNEAGITKELKAIVETSKRNTEVLNEIARGGNSLVPAMQTDSDRKKGHPSKVWTIVSCILNVTVKILAIIAFCMFAYCFIRKYFMGL